MGFVNGIVARTILNFVLENYYILYCTIYKELIPLFCTCNMSLMVCQSLFLFFSKLLLHLNFLACVFYHKYHKTI